MDITAASATVPSTSPPARSRQVRAEWSRLILLLGVAAEIVNGATALRAESVVQRLHLDPSSQVVTAGDLATVTIVYDCESPAVTGVGVGIYYDSSKLALESAAVLFSDDSVGAGDSTDDGNLDGDATTDRRYLAGWASLAGDWPGNDVAPTASNRGLMLLTLALAGGATALLLRQHR